MTDFLLLAFLIPGFVALLYILWRVERHFIIRRAKLMQNAPRSQYANVCYPSLQLDAEVILVSGRHKQVNSKATGRRGVNVRLTVVSRDSLRDPQPDLFA